MDQSALSTAGRITIADVAAVYGADALQRRIAELRANGLHYAATAIEHEIRSAASFDEQGAA